jgi:hypothetical protein
LWKSRTERKPKEYDTLLVGEVKEEKEKMCVYLS